MISLQTNVDSLNAQRNLGLDNAFQSNTIQQLTSGYRINKSGDDAAGLAIANGYQNTVTQLNQGVSNSNDGMSQLQIVDGGLSNISTILNRLQTLATQSASSTFTGDRSILNQEYSSLVSEVTRQATNINLNAGGSFNNNLNVFIGGGSNATNSSVSVNLSGSSMAVDAASLGLANTNVLGGGVGIAGNTTRLDATGATFLTATSGQASQSFTFNLATSSGATSVTATVKGNTDGTGVSESSVLSQLNGSLNQYGITAGVDSNGKLQFSGATAFNVTANAITGTGAAAGLSSTSGAAHASSNTSNYVLDGQTTYTPTAADTETLTFQAGGKSIAVALGGSGNGANVSSAIAAINAQTSSVGVYAVMNSAGTGIEFQSANSFSVNSASTVTATGAADSSATGTFSAAGYNTATAPTTGTSSNANAAIAAISAAIKAIGVVQGVVGAGENTLSYASSLAQSQISSFSSAESQIKDADVAAQAANLTKAQVLTQTSVAALAQANSEPQSILKLLQ